MKRLITLLAGTALTLTAIAQNAGDYVYTDNGRYKITTGENLLSNGDFTAGTEGWTTDGGYVLSTDTFSVENENGNSYLSVLCKENGPGNGSSLLRKVAIDYRKTYIVTYQVQGNDDVVSTTITTGDNAKNYQNIFFNTDGSLTPSEQGGAIAKAQNYSWDWSTFSYAFTPPAMGYIVFHFYAPYIGTNFDNFAVMEAQRVVDDREARSVIAYLQSYIDNPLLPNGHDILENVIGAIQERMEENDQEGYAGLIEYLDEAVSEFLDLNTANATSYLPNANFDDLATTGANQTKAGAWIIDDQLKIENPNGKSRWAIKAAEEGSPFKGNYLQDDIPYGTTNKLYEATVHQTLSNMPAAQYMFTIKARAYKLKNKTGDHDEAPRGIKVFINNDSTECYPIDAEKANTYTVYSTMAETGAMKLGFYLPDGVANHVDFDVTDLRIIGWTTEQLDEFFQGKEFAEARATLKHAIDSAESYLPNPDYLYDKDMLEAAAKSSRAQYEILTNIEDIRNETDSINEAIRTFLKHNNTLIVFRQAIAQAEEIQADPRYKDNSGALANAITAAKNYLGTLNAENHETEGFGDADIAAQTALLNKAVNDLMSASLQDDEMYRFAEWAAQDDAGYLSTLDTNNEAIITSGGASLYKETALFAGHSMNGRFAFYNTNTILTLSAQHGLQVNPTGKNVTSMAILDLKEGDQVTIHWAMGNASHGLMVSSANARYTKADGTEFTFTKTGKQTENALEKNTDGISSSSRTVLTMTADGTLDFYQGSTNSTLRVYYIGITAKENVVSGIKDVNQKAAAVKDNSVYDLMGRKLPDASSRRSASQLIIKNGKKYIAK